MRSNLFAVVFLATAVGLAAAAGPTSSSVHGREATSCANDIVIDSRGSGETSTLSAPGGVFYGFFKAVVSTRDPSARVANIPNGYPTWGSIPTMISALFKLPQQYHASVVAGKNWLSNELGVLASKCPSSKIVLTGYSQGAQVTGDVYQNTQSKQIIGVVLFGDPKFNSADPAARGGQKGLDGALGTRPLYSVAPGKQSAGHVFSYCHNRDPVCQGVSRLHFGSTYHINYGATDEPEQAAAHLAAFVPKGVSPGGGMSLYWGVAETGARYISSARADGSGYRRVAISLPPPANATIVAAGAGYIYWATYSDNTGNTWVGRVRTDGSEMDPRLRLLKDTSVNGLAVRPPYIYLAETNGIARFRLDGTGPLTVLVHVKDEPTGVAVDGTGLYWSSIPPLQPNRPGFVARISRSDLNGKGAVPIIKDAYQIGPITTDGHYLYWGDVDAKHPFIGRAGLDGSGARPQFLKTLGAPVGLAVAGGTLYWATSDLGEPSSKDVIGDQVLVSGRVNQRLLTLPDSPYSLAAG